MSQPPSRRAPRSARWLAFGSAAVFAALAVHAARVDTPTVDEAAHVPAGLHYLEHGSYELYLKTPPLFKELLALPIWLAGAVVPEADVRPGGWGPWVYAAMFQRSNEERYLDDFFLARCVTIACTLLCGALIFAWARRVADDRAAAAATALFFLNPTVIAHGHLATTDVAAATGIFGTALALRSAYRGARRAVAARVALAGLVLGVALLVKFTALLLVPAVLVVVAWERRRAPLRALGDLAIVTACALVVVNAGMQGRGAFAPLGDYAFDSSAGRAAAGWLPAALPVPLPRTYAVGLDAQAVDAERGEFGSYLLGSWSDDGWWYYNLVAFAVKLPLPTLVAIAGGAFAWRRRDAWPELVHVAAPLAALVPVLFFGNRLNIGVRYLLPVLPFALVLSAPFLARLAARRDVARWGPSALVAAELASVLWVHPAHIAYFNALAGGTSNGYRVLADSNLDWGQDLHRLPGALAELGFGGRPQLLYFGSVEPSVYGIDFRLPSKEPSRGVVAVSANFALGAEYMAPRPDGRRLWVTREDTAWLRDRAPDLRAGTLWLYDLRR